MKDFEYIINNYGVNVSLGMDVLLGDLRGVVAKDNGNYIGLSLDRDKPMLITNVHPQDERLLFTGKTRKIRKGSRSQQNYQDYLRSEVDLSFAEWMGFKK